MVIIKYKPRHIQDEIDIRYNFPQLVDGANIP